MRLRYNQDGAATRNAPHKKAIATPIKSKVSRMLGRDNRLTALLVIMLCVACNRERGSTISGDPARGKEAIQRYACNSCHKIPGVPGPKGMVGPPLDHIATRNLIAGKLPNNPQTMIQWLQNPPAFDPQATMPNLGVTPNDSRDITAYLYTLR